MDAALGLIGYAHAPGRAQAAWRFTETELRRASALATVSATWDIFRRDAGAGADGTTHEEMTEAARLLFVEDPRRDGLLLWLVDHGAPAIADAANTIARRGGAHQRFSAEAKVLLDAAREAIATQFWAWSRWSGSSQAPAGRRIRYSSERLRGHAGFPESEGTEVRHALPRGTLSR